jgi:hypothetical protein
VDGVFQDARHAAVVLRCNEEQRVDGGDRILERSARRRIIGVEVAVVKRKIPYRNLRELQMLGRQLNQRRRERAIDCSVERPPTM